MARKINRKAKNKFGYVVSEAQLWKNYKEMKKKAKARGVSYTPYGEFKIK